MFLLGLVPPLEDWPTSWVHGLRTDAAVWGLRGSPPPGWGPCSVDASVLRAEHAILSRLGPPWSSALVCLICSVFSQPCGEGLITGSRFRLSTPRVWLYSGQSLSFYVNLAGRCARVFPPTKQTVSDEEVVAYAHEMHATAASTGAPSVLIVADRCRIHSWMRQSKCFFPFNLHSTSCH